MNTLDNTYIDCNILTTILNIALLCKNFETNYDSLSEIYKPNYKKLIYSYNKGAQTGAGGAHIKSYGYRVYQQIDNSSAVVKVTKNNIISDITNYFNNYTLQFSNNNNTIIIKNIKTINLDILINRVVYFYINKFNFLIGRIIEKNKENSDTYTTNLNTYTETSTTQQTYTYTTTYGRTYNWGMHRFEPIEKVGIRTKTTTDNKTYNKNEFINLIYNNNTINRQSFQLLNKINIKDINMIKALQYDALINYFINLIKIQNNYKICNYKYIGSYL